MPTNSLRDIDRFINATRINVPGRVNPEMYRPLILELSRLASALELPTEIKLVYSASRRVELVTLSDTSWLVYDQYIGQSMNLLNRLFIEADGKRPAITYFHKVLAERLLEVGRLEEALHCAKIYHDNRDDLKSRAADEKWRFFLIEAHEAFLLHHEFGHRAYSKESLLPVIREHAQEIIETLINSKERSIEQVIEDLRRAPPEALHDQDADELVLELLDSYNAHELIIKSQVAYLKTSQAHEEVFCDLFAADRVLSLEMEKGRNVEDTLRAIYIGFYHLQALEYLRRLPNLLNKDPDWDVDIVPQVQARGQCLLEHLVFLYQMHLHAEKRLPSNDISRELIKLKTTLLKDQKRHYEVIYDSAMALCDNLRKDNWIQKLGRKAINKLHRKLRQNKHDPSIINDADLRKIILIMTGWAEKSYKGE